MTEEYASIGVQLGARYDGSPIVDRGRRAAGRRLRALHAVRRAGRPRAALLAGPGPRLWRLAVRPVRQGLHAAAARRQGRRTRRRSKPRRSRRHVPLKVIDLPQSRRARSLRPRPRAHPARPIRRLARRRAAVRSRPPDRTPDRRNLGAVLPCATPSQIDFWRSARQSRPQIPPSRRRKRVPRNTVMSKFLSLIAPPPRCSPRRPPMPSSPRPIIPTSPSRSSLRCRPAAASTPSRESSPRRCAPSSASPSSSRTRAAPAATSRRSPCSRPSPTATR